MKIGVFDSGIGGKGVASALALAFPQDTIAFASDNANVPYGTKTPKEIKKLALAAVQPLIQQDCRIIVIACNTATTNAIEYLRSIHPTIFFVGLEPMVKPAAEITRSGTIAVCATTATLASPAYHTLKKTWGKDVKIIEPDCSDWANLIEHGQADTIDVENTMKTLTKENCDVIVLACTHYHWLKERFAAAAGSSITILEPTDTIVRQISHLKQDYNSFTAAIN